jgi:DNA sulfur modification protein DndB
MNPGGIFEVSFPAVRGIQAGREYYVAMCPLETVVRLIKLDSDNEAIPPELRAQRVVNKARIPSIARYVVDNPDSYAFSSLTVSVSRAVSFAPFSENGHSGKLGILSVPYDATFLINDGQHRRAAIEQALAESPDLKHETISVVIFVDQGLERSQQLFADLNRYVVRPTPSLSILYDHRDPMALLALDVADAVSVFKGMTEKAKATISNRSTKLFTLSGIFHANCELLGKTKTKKVTEQERALAITFWNEVAKHIPEWQLAAQKKVSPSELRRDYIHAHGIALRALGRAGVDLICQPPAVWKKALDRLKNLDWSRSNAQLWEGRATIAGRISKAHNNIILTTNLIKKTLGLPLNPSEEQIESNSAKGRRA